MTGRIVAGSLLLAVGVFGCATSRQKPPPAQTVKLGASTVEYRSYSPPTADPCRVEPRGLRDELDKMNALLAEFLNSTSAGYEGIWTDEQQAMLTEAQTSLPPALEAHQATLARIPSCKDFDPAVDFKETVARGNEFTAQARKRMAQAPDLLTFLKAKKDVEAWRTAQVASQSTARTSVCGKKKGRDIFYASEDETGRKEWHFCDGALLGQAPGAAPEMVPENTAAGKPAKKRQPKPYLDVAAKYPVEKMSKAPRLPEKPKGAAAEEEKVDLDQPADP